MCSPHAAPMVHIEPIRPCSRTGYSHHAQVIGNVAGRVIILAFSLFFLRRCNGLPATPYEAETT
jgi:hypothetical protein